MHKELVRIPFKTFITTNYDDVLENASEASGLEFGAPQIFPNLFAGNLERKTTYHVHGMIDHSDIPRSIESLIFTASDYKKAYGEVSTLPLFLNTLFVSHSIVFIGFGLEEETLFNVLEQSTKTAKFIRDFPISRTGQKTFKFALLPVFIQEEGQYPVDHEIELPNLEQQLAQIEKIDNRLRTKFGILPIRFKTNRKTYYALKKIIGNLYETTRYEDELVAPDIEIRGSGHE